MNKKTSKAKSVSADIEVRVKSASGTTYRALVEKRNKKVTYLCQHIRGAFTKDRKIAKPLTELVISGEYTLPHAKHREMVEKLFKVTLSAPERKPRRRSTNDAIQRVEVIPPWLMDDEEQQPQTETRSDAEIEAALWQEVEEARETDLAEERAYGGLRSRALCLCQHAHEARLQDACLRAALSAERNTQHPRSGAYD